MVANALEISHLLAHLGCINHTTFIEPLWSILLGNPLPFPNGRQGFLGLRRRRTTGRREWLDPQRDLFRSPSYSSGPLGCLLHTKRGFVFAYKSIYLCYLPFITNFSILFCIPQEFMLVGDRFLECNIVGTGNNTPTVIILRNCLLIENILLQLLLHVVGLKPCLKNIACYRNRQVNCGILSPHPLL